jgi:hypothetical protein
MVLLIPDVLKNLQLFESTAKPHTYMFGATYRSTAHRNTSYFREWCTPKFFDDAFKDFKTFFRLKTGYEWDYRLRGIRINRKFVYTPPEEGKPVGSVPLELIEPVRWEPVEESKEDEESDSSDEVDEPVSNTEGSSDNHVVIIHDSDSESESEADDGDHDDHPKNLGPTTSLLSTEDVRYPVVNIFDEGSFESPFDIERPKNPMHKHLR